MLVRDIITAFGAKRTPKTTLGFYIQRLRPESVTRRLGMTVVLLLFLFHIITVIVPPKPSSAANCANDVVCGGISSQQELLSKLNQRDYAAIYGYFGVHAAQIQASTLERHGLRGDSGVLSVGRSPHSSADEPLTIPGQQTALYIRPLSSWGTWSVYDVLHGKTDYGDDFWILLGCGNIAVRRLPPPPKRIIKKPLPPAPTAPELSYRKTADNLTKLTADGKPTDANGTTVPAGTKLRYNLIVHNSGNAVEQKFMFDEDISDILEYADLGDYGNAHLINQNSISRLVWPAVDIAAGATVTKTFQVTIKNPIPDRPVGVSNPQSYDLTLDNVFFHNQVSIHVLPPLPKQIEYVSQTLPQTGPGLGNLVFAILIAGAVFFYLRSKLLAFELTILQREGGKDA